MAIIPDKAFILAAGLGTRMRPLTDNIPKPLVEVSGRSLLNRTLDHLSQSGVREVVINTHHLAHKVEEHVLSRNDMKIILSYEPDLLDTGGGIKKMLQHFGSDPFFVLSGDGLWADVPGENALKKLAGLWNEKIMDIALLLQPVARMKITEGVGDYNLLENGLARRSLNKKGSHMFTSIRINHPRIFDGAADGAFSYLKMLDAAEEKGRLYGLEHQGEWFHISTLSDLKAINNYFASETAA